MLKLFPNPDKLIKLDTQQQLTLAMPHLFKVWGILSLALAAVSVGGTIFSGVYLIGGAIVLFYLALGIWLVTARRAVTFDAHRRVVYFSMRHLLGERRSKVIPFDHIASIYLDFDEHTTYGFFTPHLKIRRKWLIFLVLNSRQTVTIARQYASYTIDQAPNLSNQTVSWEKLTRKVCQVTGKLLVKTPSVPGRAPHTFIDVVNQIVQRHLSEIDASHPLKDRSVHLRSHPNGSLEIIIDGDKYRELDDISEPAIHDLIQSAIDDWTQLVGASMDGALPADIMSKISQLKDLK